MFRNMVTSLFKNQRIQTTDAKAKELRRWADRLITLAKRGDLHARRQALAIVREKGVVHKLFEDAPKRFGEASGGYTRVIKIGRRAGDAAPVSIVELVSAEVVAAKPKKKGVKKKEKPPAFEKQALKSKTKAEKEPLLESAEVSKAKIADEVETKTVEKEKVAAAENSEAEKDPPAVIGDPSPKKNK
jgi:large subunit ribosomal protein L17